MFEPTVIIEQGKLRGKICKDYNGRPFYSFQGIPYAKPPVGDLRFKVSKVNNKSKKYVCKLCLLILSSTEVILSIPPT